jgi:hypothetical protein
MINFCFNAELSARGIGSCLVQNRLKVDIAGRFGAKFSLSSLVQSADPIAWTTLGLAARKCREGGVYGLVTRRCRGTRPLSESII